MKYLLTGRRNMVPDPDPETLIGLMQAAKEYHVGLLEDGTMEGLYGFAEGNGGFAVVNADSHEGAQAILLQFPLMMNYDWEIKPVLDLIAQYDMFIERWKSQIS